MKHLPKYVVGAGDVFVRVQYVQERGFQTRAYVPLKREKHTTIWLLSSLLARSSPSSLVEKVVEATVYTTYLRFLKDVKTSFVEK